MYSRNKSTKKLVAGLQCDQSHCCIHIVHNISRVWNYKTHTYLSADTTESAASFQSSVDHKSYVHSKQQSRFVSQFGVAEWNNV